MENSQLKKAAIDITIRSMDRAVANWLTFNDSINTYIEDVSSKARLLNIDIDRNEEEISIFDYNDDYTLVTTSRVVSKVDGVVGEILHKNIKSMKSVSNPVDFNKLEPKVETVEIKGVNGQELTYRVDSAYPSYFLRMLIYNLVSHCNNGRWYVNPR